MARTDSTASAKTGRYAFPGAAAQIREVAYVLPEADDLVVAEITHRAAVVSGLAAEPPRYYLRHALNFRVHDERHPHHPRRHGRADTGWKAAPEDD